MYDLPHHKENDPAILNEFIAQHPFAFLSGCDAENRPVATQVPLLMEEREGVSYLVGHIMKNTDHHKAFMQNPSVLAIFTSPSTYVSATWYSTPGIASTWNYMSVHVEGTLRFIEDARLHEMLSKLSLHFEGGDNASPPVFENLPDEFKKKYMPMIIGFEIEIEKMKNVFKLSQDRDKQSYLNIIEKLKEKGLEAQFIASEMEKRTKDLFSDED